VIGTFNTCLWGPTERSLTDTGGGYNLEGACLPHTHSPTFPTSCLPFRLVAPPGLQFNQFPHLNQALSFKDPMAAAWSSNHSAIYRSLHLRLAITNDLSLVVGHKDRSETLHNATRASNQLLQLNAHPGNTIKIEEEYNNSRIVVRCTGACLGLARIQRSRLVLAPEAPRVLAPCDLSQMCKYEMPK
jgi:hypothetical protein